MPPKELSRFELNRLVRVALQRHGTDLAQLHFSCVGRSVRLTGILVKVGNKDFLPKQIEGLNHDLGSIQGIREVIYELENWNISGGSITPKEEKEGKKDGGGKQGEAKEGAGGGGGGAKPKKKEGENPDGAV